MIKRGKYHGMTYISPAGTFKSANVYHINREKWHTAQLVISHMCCNSRNDEAQLLCFRYDISEMSDVIDGFTDVNYSVRFRCSPINEGRVGIMRYNM